MIPNTSPTPNAVLCKALFAAAEQVTLSQEELAAVIGSNRSSVSRLKNKGMLDTESKQGELAILLIRVARSLSALAGGDDQWIRHFMRSPNKITRGIPAEQVQTVQGLLMVLNTLDALRGKA